MNFGTVDKTILSKKLNELGVSDLVYQCCIHKSYPSLHTDSVLRQSSKGAMQNVSISINFFMTAVGFYNIYQCAIKVTWFT